MEGVLGVVDMQRYFSASCDVAVIDAVQREMRRAMQLGWAIVVLQVPYIDYHIFKQKLEPTHSCLLNLVRDYPKFALVEEKQTTDGSAYLEEICHARGFPLGLVRICGVNINSCIFETVASLSRRYCDTVEVVKDACNDVLPPGEEGVQVLDMLWQRFADLPNVVLIG